MLTSSLPFAPCPPVEQGDTPQSTRLADVSVKTPEPGRVAGADRRDFDSVLSQLSPLNTDCNTRAHYSALDVRTPRSCESISSLPRQMSSELRDTPTSCSDECYIPRRLDGAPGSEESHMNRSVSIRHCRESDVDAPHLMGYDEPQIIGGQRGAIGYPMPLAGPPKATTSLGG